MNADERMDVDARRLDASVRARHAEAVAGLSLQVQAQLAQRSNAALRGATRRPAHGLRNAALACAALGALALGLRFQLPPEADPAAARAAPVAVASTPPGSATVGVALDQDPDFYVWLGGSGSDRLAME